MNFHSPQIFLAPSGAPSLLEVVLFESYDVARHSALVEGNEGVKIMLFTGYGGVRGNEDGKEYQADDEPRELQKVN